MIWFDVVGIIINIIIAIYLFQLVRKPSAGNAKKLSYGSIFLIIIISLSILLINVPSIFLPSHNQKLGAEESDSSKKEFNYKVNSYFVAQYIRARESYIPAPFVGDYKISPAIAENYNIVRLMSEPTTVYVDFMQAMNPKNPESNATRLGQDGSRNIQFKSITFIEPQVAEIHFVINEKSNNMATPKQYNKVLHMKFEYIKMNLTEGEKLINPLGFRVLEYHLTDDQ